MGVGRLGALCVLAALAMAAPDDAVASGVREFTPECTHFCETDIQFTALPGERNVVSARFIASDSPSTDELGGGGTVVVTDAGAPLTPSQGCVAVDAHTARCDTYDYAPLGYGTFDLGDRGDRLDGSQLDGPVVARGGSGDDSILGGVSADSLDAGPGRDFVDGGGGRDFAVYRDLDPRLRVDLASSRPQGAPASRDTLRSIENLDALKVRGAVLIGDEGPNILLAGRDGVVIGRSGRDQLDVRGGGHIYGGAGNDTIGGIIYGVGEHGAPRKISCGWGSDYVAETRLIDLVAANCEQVEPDVGEVFDRLFTHPRRKHAIALISYGCFIEQGCPLTIIGRLGTPDGRIVSLRRLRLHFDRNGVVDHRYALRLNAAGQKLLRRRGRMKVCVYYREGPYRTPPRFTPRNGFTLVVRR